MFQFVLDYGRKCRRVNYTKRNTSHVYRFMAARGYIDDTKHEAKRRRKRKSAGEPEIPIRMTDWSGGVFRFPFVAWPDVHAAMARDIDSGCQDMYLNEIGHVDDGMKLLYELDYERLEPVPVQEILRHVRILQETTRTFFRGDCDCLVLLSMPKPKRKDVNMYVVASGAHVVFYKKSVTLSQANQLTYSCRLEFERQGVKDADVDDCYTRQGCRLRAIGSRKIHTCVVCGGRNVGAEVNQAGLECTYCKGFRRVVHPAVYKFYVALADDGSPDEVVSGRLRRDTVQLLNLASVVPHPGMSSINDYTVPEHVARFIPKSLQPRDPLQKQTGCVYKGERKPSATFEVVEDASILDLLKRCIENVHSNYRGTMLGKVVKNRQRYLVNLKGNGRNFCRVIGKCHSSNRVFFVFERKSHRILAGCHNAECRATLKNDPGKNKYSVPLKGPEVCLLFPKEKCKFLADYSVSSFPGPKNASESAKKRLKTLANNIAARAKRSQELRF